MKVKLVNTDLFPFRLPFPAPSLPLPLILPLLEPTIATVTNITSYVAKTVLTYLDKN